MTLVVAGELKSIFHLQDFQVILGIPRHCNDYPKLELHCLPDAACTNS